MKRSEAIIKETQRAIDKMTANSLTMLINDKGDAVRIANHFRGEGYECTVEMRVYFFLAQYAITITKK